MAEDRLVAKVSVRDAERRMEALRQAVRDAWTRRLISDEANDFLRAVYASANGSGDGGEDG